MLSNERLSNRLPDGLRATDLDDIQAFRTFSHPMQDWWSKQFGEFADLNDGLLTAPQKDSIPLVKRGENTLIASPTGTGKTLSMFAGVIDELYEKAQVGELEDTVYCVYVSPLRSLANDIQRNLKQPLDGINSSGIDIRQATRHGDTTDSEKKEMRENPPHILNTTPESLAILLNSPRFREHLRSVEYVIVDEIHSLAESKRGTHLSVSLERLEELCDNEITRIGASATVEPLDEVAQFLVGTDRDYTIVDKRFVRDYDIQVQCPVDNIVEEDRKEITDRFYDRIHDLVTSSSNTIIFTNTRSGAERVLRNIRQNSDQFTEKNSAAHHGSLSQEKRESVESRLKEGELRVVTTSTSLELGIDMGKVDLVIQVGSPKSIASLMQRIGRAGHQVGETVRGRVLTMDRDELVECTVMADRALEGFIDRVHIPKNPQDVLCQHVYGMAINRVWKEEEILRVIRSAYPYREYSRSMYNSLLKYLSGDFDGLEDKNVYPKIWRDENDEPGGKFHYKEFDPGTPLIGKKGKKARVIYMTNIGTIPDSFTMDVKTRNGDWVGDLDEEYLNTLDKGDVFVLGGEKYRYMYRRGSKVYVDRTTESPNVPSWFSERLPMSFDLGVEIADFQEEIEKRLSKTTPKDTSQWIRENFPVDENVALSLTRMYDQQVRFSDGSVTSNENIAVEKRKDGDELQYLVLTCYGRRFNDGLSRVLAQKVSDKKGINVKIAVSDHGFSLRSPTEIDLPEVIQSIKKENVREHLHRSLSDSDFLKRYFRINAVRSLMILRNYKGNRKSAKQQQVSSEMLLGFAKGLDNFPVLNETYREIVEDMLAEDKVREIVDKIGRDISISYYTNGPSPRAFGLALLSDSDVVLAEDEDEALEKYHQSVVEKVGETDLDVEDL